MSKDDEIKLQWASDSKTDGDWVVYAGEPINSDEPMTGHGADLVALDHVTKERDAALAERDAARAEMDALREAAQGVIDLIDEVRVWIGGFDAVEQMRALLPEPEEGGEDE